MKSKAYIFANAADYDTDDLSEQVTFAETPGKAKQDFCMENGSATRTSECSMFLGQTNTVMLIIFMSRNG